MKFLVVVFLSIVFAQSTFADCKRLNSTPENLKYCRFDDLKICSDDITQEIVVSSYEGEIYEDYQATECGTNYCHYKEVVTQYPQGRFGTNRIHAILYPQGRTLRIVYPSATCVYQIEE